MPHEQRRRDEDGRIVSVQATEQTDNIITGPLGIWPFPILNILLNAGGQESESQLVVTEVVRDEDGRIQAIEEFRR